MMYVYRYIDSLNGTVKYIGITKNLRHRVSEHTRDKWGNDAIWQIDYCVVNTYEEAYALETMLINSYATYRWYNKAKALLDAKAYPLMDKIIWKPYSPLFNGKNSHKGNIVCKIITIDDAEKIIKCIKDGYVDGIKHRPNPTVAIFLLCILETGISSEALLRCTINDICHLNAIHKEWFEDVFANFVLKQSKNIYEESPVFNMTSTNVQKSVRYATKYLSMNNVSVTSFRKLSRVIRANN